MFFVCIYLVCCLLRPVANPESFVEADICSNQLV